MRDVLAALAQRRQLDRQHVRAGRTGPGGTARRRPRRRGPCSSRDSTRTSTLIGASPPTRSNSCSWSARSSLTCIAGGTSPTSSRNSVPPSASSNRPSFCLIAPVNAPFSWPNSSLSSKVSVSAPQLTLMNGPFARLLRRWIARAISSLPVPLSPAMNTVVSLAATFSTVRRTMRHLLAAADELGEACLGIARESASARRLGLARGRGASRAARARARP